MASPPSLNSTLILSFSLLLLTLPSSSSSFPTGSLPTRSGYLVVSSTSGSSIFYAFYEAQNPISPSLSKTPLLVWLQGGPGCSSMTGNFYELGPWRVNHSIQLEPNPGAWNRAFGLLFLDNPIGTGFSIAANTDEIPRDQTGVAEHLFVALQRFLSLNPGFKTRPLYITGESYAGKYVPAIGYYILKKNPKLAPDQRVNLAGVAIGNGLTDPVNQVTTHAINAYYTGLINDKQKTQLDEAQKRAVNLVEAQKWAEATDARNQVLRMLQNMTGLPTLYDMRRKIPYETNLVEEFLKKTEVKKALGVNESMEWEDCSGLVGSALHEDVMKSVRYMVEFLVRETKVLLYQGQCDLRDGVVSTEAWMKKMKWEGMRDFSNVERRVWRLDREVAGYVQKWGSLSHVVVLGAGHFVPTDQDVHSQVMIENWVLERGDFGEEGVGIQPDSHPRNLL